METLGRWPLGKLRWRNEEDNIKMNFKGIRSEDVDWIQLAQDRF